MGQNRTCLGEFDITMESGLFLDSQVDILRHNIIGDVCGIRHAYGTGPIAESFIYIMGVSSLQCEISNSYLYRLL